MFQKKMMQKAGAIAVGSAALVALGTGSAGAATLSSTMADQIGNIPGAAKVLSQLPAGWATSAASALPKPAVTIHDDLKPNAEIMISSPCLAGDLRATVTTSFGAKATMSPAADMPELIGYVKAPNNIGKGPANGYHTATVTCHSGVTNTVTFKDAGNGNTMIPR
ncbi:hypothetical protein [Corynebacterium ulceribovis]|uniref:hypothetical protein n=1 Tax=Corynebacterium ulceribovis TaxID=487732 RepID=UPI00039CDFEC|nr:hypothetical protein [Corynebacterium ulceribovis]